MSCLVVVCRRSLGRFLAFRVWIAQLHDKIVDVEPGGALRKRRVILSPTAQALDTN